MIELLPIHTARLVLRRFAAGDLREFQTYRSDPAVARYQSWEPMSDREAKMFLAAQEQQAFGAPEQWLQVAVTRRDTGKLIGDIGICILDEDSTVAEIGYTLSQSSQGQGYATEAVTALLDAVLGRAIVRSVLAVTDGRNTASLRLLRRVGFSHHRTTATTFRGEPCEEHTFVITDAQWTNRWR